MINLTQGAWRWIFLTALVVGLALLAYRLQRVLNPLLFSLLIAYILNPIIVYFEKKGWRRITVVSTLYVLLFVFGVFFLGIIVPLMSSEAAYFYRAFFIGDSYVGQAQGKPFHVGETPLTEDLNGNGQYDPPLVLKVKKEILDVVAVYEKRHPALKKQISQWTQDIMSNLQKTLGMADGQGWNLLGWVQGHLKKGFSVAFYTLTYLVLVPIYIFFFLYYLSSVWKFILEYLPPRYKKDIVRILYRIDKTIAHFVRGRVTICFIKGLITFIGLFIVGSGVPLLFAFLAVISSVIPYLVLITAALPAFVVSTLTYGLFDWHTLLVLAVFALAEIIEGLVLTPLILGKEVALHPVVIVIGMLIGAELGGFFGLLVAIPALSIAKILWEEVVRPNLKHVLNSPPFS